MKRLLLISSLMVLLTYSALAQEATTCEPLVVQADDWLSKIAEKAYGDPLAYTIIVEATNVHHEVDKTFAYIENPDVIEVGWQLCIPATTDLTITQETPSTTETSAEENQAETTMVIVSPDEVANYVSLYQAVQPLPLLSTQHANLSYDQAYAFQQAFIDALTESGEAPIGYKLGLTGPTLPFGATEPVHGRLFASMVQPLDAVIQTDEFVKTMIEVEVAYLFGQDVAYPATKEDIKASVVEVAPAIELPDLMYADMQNLSWLDLIATGVAPRQLIIGEKISLGDLDINSIQTVAKREGKVINEAPTSAAMGDQWAALMFLVEDLNEQGQQIKAGDIVITGSLGPMLPGEPGQYEVNFGELGAITFEIQ